MKPHGGYRNLLSFQTATIIYDLTVIFVDKYISKFSRTKDQMPQAARSGRQNIAEGSQASGTSSKTEIKLVGIARASLEELLIDLEDYLRQNNLKLWDKDSAEAKAVRAFGYKSDRSYRTYMSYMTRDEDFANCIICLIHQANYLLDRQLEALEKDFLQNGGFSENLFKRRVEARK
jgi:restriction system protein